MGFGVDLKLSIDVGVNWMEKGISCIVGSLGKVMERMKRKERRVE